MSEDVKPYAGTAPADPTPDELRELIAQTGLSQRRAAEALGMGERMMRYYASGQEKIPLVVIYALRYLASQVPSTRVADQWQELPEDEMYFICPEGGSVQDLYIATSSTAVARTALENQRREGRPHEAWHARRVLLDPPAANESAPG